MVIGRAGARNRLPARPRASPFPHPAARVRHPEYVRERAALAWAEALTLVHETHAPDDVYEEARKRFSEEELVSLTIAIVAINGWNRLSIGFRTVPGAYQPARPGKA